MPPGGHSSSSHHSSHSSHHSSHSSHSSRSSHSRGPTMKKVTKTVPRPARSRVNQPSNYKGKRATHDFKCKQHDYRYYGEDWTDSARGLTYKKGFYDESGNHYDTLIIHKPDGKLESLFDCDYCGTQVKAVWEEGAIPQCQNCGANLIETMGNAIHDTLDTSTIEKVSYVETTGSKISRIISYIFTGSFIAIILAAFGFAAYVAKRDAQNNVDSNIKLFGKSVYVEDIDRTLEWNDEYKSYYDPVTDCYIWYNTDVEPAVWQYWYEDISSDFGNYGWMEYELQENQWYIEESRGNWIMLPEEYDTSKLWHITGDLAGTSYSKDLNIERFGEYVYVDTESDECYWDNEMHAYEVKSHDCLIRINFDVVDPSIQYWYEDISSEFCKDGYGGWMEYDYEEDAWYIVDSKDEWSKMTGDMSDLWHVSRYVVGETEYAFSVSGEEHFTDADAVQNCSVYVRYYFNEFEETDYYTYDVPVFFSGTKHLAGVTANFENVDEEPLEALTASYVSTHHDEIKEFFEEYKNEDCVTSFESLENNHNTVGHTLDVSSWFGDTITITADGGTITYEYKVTGVELAISRDYYYGDVNEYFSAIALQISGKSESGEKGFTYVTGIEFQFHIDPSATIVTYADGAEAATEDLEDVA